MDALNTRTYAVINLTDIDKIDFQQIGETSAFTIRKSLDDTQFVIKWKDGYTPTFITDGSVVPVETYNHADILELMSTPAWSEPIPVE
jgi:hypothetical protein